jgi:tetratricopeptide (TPR) repeat protein
MRSVRWLICFGLSWGLLACVASPRPRPLVLDPLLAPVAPDAQGDALLAAVARTWAAGELADASLLAATFAPEFHASARIHGQAEHLALLACLEAGGALLADWWRGTAVSMAAGKRLSAALVDCAQQLQRGDREAALASVEGVAAAAGNGPWLSVVLGWRGFALAACGDPAADRALHAAVAAAAALGPREAARWQAVRCATLGDPAAWAAAVQLACQWQAAEPVAADPWLWRRLLELTPPDAVWPGEWREVVAAACCDLRAGGSSQSLAQESAAALGWWLVGQQHRRRGELLAALFAWRKAEELLQSPWLRAAATAGQARVLLAAGRSGDARAALVARLEAEPAAGAVVLLAQLAAIELAEERAAAARQLLERALQLAPAGSWPLRGMALANLGVARCLLGDAEAGLQQLQAARAEFLALGDHEGLADCLDNEAVCARAFGRGDIAAIERMQETLRRQGIAALAVPAGGQP